MAQAPETRYTIIRDAFLTGLWGSCAGLLPVPAPFMGVVGWWVAAWAAWATRSTVTRRLAASMVRENSAENAARVAGGGGTKAQVGLRH